jgi:hypothetical protein
MKLKEGEVKLAFKDAYEKLKQNYPDPALIPREEWKFVKELEPNKIYLWAFGGADGMRYDDMEQDLIMITDKKFKEPWVKRGVKIWNMSAPQRYRQDGNGLVVKDYSARRVSRWISYSYTITKLSPFGLSGDLDEKWIFGPIAEIRPTVDWLNWNQDPFEVKS